MNDGYNPLFKDAVHRKRALAQMRRMMREAEDRAQALERAARAAADAILAAAYDEAREIMARAHDEPPPQAMRPVAEILGEVAAEFSVPPQAVTRGRRTRVTKAALRETILRTWRERQDLTSTQIARILHCAPSTVRRFARLAGGGNG